MKMWTTSGAGCHPAQIVTLLCGEWIHPVVRSAPSELRVLGGSVDTRPPQFSEGPRVLISTGRTNGQVLLHAACAFARDCIIPSSWRRGSFGLIHTLQYFTGRFPRNAKYRNLDTTCLILPCLKRQPRWGYSIRSVSWEPPRETKEWHFRFGGCCHRHAQSSQKSFPPYVSPKQTLAAFFHLHTIILVNAPTARPFQSPILPSVSLHLN